MFPFTLAILRKIASLEIKKASLTIELTTVRDASACYHPYFQLLVIGSQSTAKNLTILVCCNGQSHQILINSYLKLVEDFHISVITSSHQPEAFLKSPLKLLNYA